MRRNALCAALFSFPQERVVKLLYAKTFEDPQDSSYQNSATDRSGACLSPGGGNVCVCVGFAIPIAHVLIAPVLRADPGRPATASGYAPTVGQQPQEGDYPPGRFRPSSAPSRKQVRFPSPNGAPAGGGSFLCLQSDPLGCDRRPTTKPPCRSDSVPRLGRTTRWPSCLARRIDGGGGGPRWGLCVQSE